MGDLGDILYILVMLGALVFSAIRKSKAKPQGPMDNSRSSYDPMAEEGPLLNELRELFNKDKPGPRPEPVKKETPPPPMVRKVQRAPIADQAKTKRPQKSMEVLDTQEEGFVFNADEVDLRKAVIYSEILNRPYQ